MKVPAGIDVLLTTVADDQTIVPAPQSNSRAKAHAFLAQLRERGQAIELRTGRTIGEGGMGVVHEAEQIALGRIVAVKTLKPGRTDAHAAQDMLREAWVTGALEHPNVVPIHHLEITDGTPLLVMTRVVGVEWSALVRDAGAVERRFGTADLLGWNVGILIQVLNALRFAHSRGILHRDLKPANVMIGDFGEVYLLDWGIAVSLRDDGSGRFPLATEATELAGTPAYMAPEMLGADVGIPLAEHTDVYVAGAVLYELVVGHPPHRGASSPAIIASIVASDPTFPAGVPAELVQICRRAMRPDPADRYASIAELQAALRGYLEHRGSAQLTARARDKLGELVTLCDGAPDDARREQIYRALAICRFGFHEALVAWRDNTEAREGITRATLAVAEYELRAGDPRTAITLLNELDERHPLLETAQAAVAEQTKKQQELTKLAAAHDPTPGINVRLALALLIGAFFSIAPVLGAVFEVGTRTHIDQLAVQFAGLAFVLGFGVWWRRRSQVTSINRSMLQIAGFLFVAQAILVGGTWLMGATLRETQALMVFLWGVFGGMIAIWFDRSMVISSLGHWVGFLIAVRDPELVPYVMGVTNGIFTVVVALRWRQGTVRIPLSAT